MTPRERQILEWIKENPMISQAEIAEKAGITRSSVGVHISHLIEKGHLQGRGYVIGHERYSVVVGGCNIDIGGTSDKPLLARDSNPGHVMRSFGGVGRNIAHNMRLLGVETKLLTAFGNDENAVSLIGNCNELGIDISPALRFYDERTSTYLFVNDANGDMQVAINDMAIYDRLTPEAIAKSLPVLERASAIVMDTNIPEDTICHIAEIASAAGVPVFVDPVSVIKAGKLAKIIGKIHTLKPNLIEAELLSGVKIDGQDDIAKAAAALLEMGLTRVFITLGKDGVYAADREQGLHIKTASHKKPAVVNTTGCGDAFTAAIVWAHNRQLPLRETAIAGLSAAECAMAFDGTINPALREDILLANI